MKNALVQHLPAVVIWTGAFFCGVLSVHLWTPLLGTLIAFVLVPVWVWFGFRCRDPLPSGRLRRWTVVAGRALQCVGAAVAVVSALQLLLWLEAGSPTGMGGLEVLGPLVGALASMALFIVGASLTLLAMVGRKRGTAEPQTVAL